MATIQDMIKKLEKFGDELQSVSGKTVTFMPTAKGMIDRQCPSCSNLFMVHDKDWERTGNHFYCPSCRHSSQRTDFTTDEHSRLIKQGIERSLLGNWHNNAPIPQNILEVQSTLIQEDPVACPSCASTYSSAQPIQYCACCGIPWKAEASNNVFSNFGQ